MFEVQMPQAGQSMEEGTIVRWLKNEGDKVQSKDILFEVETDKAVVEVEAGHDGILRKIIIPVGQMVPIRTRVGLIGDTNEPIPADAGSPAPAAPSAPIPAPAAAVSAAVTGGTLTDVLMPQAGQSMEEGTIVRWLKNEGDQVQAKEILLEVETDKAVVEVEAGHDGTLRKILVPVGTTVPVRTRIALIGDANAAIPADAVALPAKSVAVSAPKAVAQVATIAAPVAVPTSGSIKASPAARKIAGERGIDLASVGTGSGPSGRITSRDLPAQAAQIKPATGAGVAPSVSSAAPAAVSGQASRRRLTPMRKAVARNLLASKQTIPHFYMQLTVNAVPMSDLQKAEKSKYQCSLNDFVTKACAKAIREFPAFRSRIEGDEMVEFNDVNIGIAVGMDEGLVVPVILRADTLSIKELATETRRLAQSAKTGRIENMGKGVFTITNLGMFGIEQFTAIVNPPEAAILAVGAMRETVVVQDGAMWAGKVMTVTLSADHRVVDGMPAAKFMARLKELLENPAQLV
ncbi:MAG: 2-oxo acid dehydrogenase subunit E2 [bacterium]|jgi:pyruvate dehydrogenase E2 component (dihydrolipoamide acetyltransferase)